MKSHGRKPVRSASRAEVAHGPAEERAALPGDADGPFLFPEGPGPDRTGERESRSRRAERQVR